MKRHVLIFGLVGGGLVTLLRLIEYRFSSSNIRSRCMVA